MKKIVGWSEEPLNAEKKLANLGYTFDMLCETLRTAQKTGNRLKDSEFIGLHFTGWSRGYNVHMKLGRGHWFAWGHEITTASQEQERAQYRLWNNIQKQYDWAKGLRPEPDWVLLRDMEAWRRGMHL